MINNEQAKKEWLHENRLVQVRKVVSTSRINVPQCKLQESICMLQDEQIMKGEKRINEQMLKQNKVASQYESSARETSFNYAKYKVTKSTHL